MINAAIHLFSGPPEYVDNCFEIYDEYLVEIVDASLLSEKSSSRNAKAAQMFAMFPYQDKKGPWHIFRNKNLPKLT